MFVFIDVFFLSLSLIFYVLIKVLNDVELDFPPKGKLLDVTQFFL